jgi:hypothetical protein
MTTITTTQEQTALTSAEQRRLQEFETTIERGLQTFYEVGYALAEIREQRLYRAEYGTFEDYCTERWKMRRNYANKLIAASEVAGNLGTTVPKPASERQTRPLAKLPAEEQGPAWEEAVERSGGKPTARHVEEVVKERTEPPAPAPAPEPQRPDLPPGWYYQDSSNPADIIAINRENASQSSGFCRTHEEAAKRAWDVHRTGEKPAPPKPAPPPPAARIIDMPEARRQAMMAELEALGYDVKYHKGCVSNNRKGAPGHMNENLYYVEDFVKRLQIARQNFEREQEQQAERERMRSEIARKREEYQSWPDEAPVCDDTIIQCMVDAHRLLLAGDAQQAQVQAQRFRAHPPAVGYIGAAITGMQRAMEGQSE